MSADTQFCPMDGCDFGSGPLHATDGGEIRDADSHLAALTRLVEHLREDHAAVDPWEIA